MTSPPSPSPRPPSRAAAPAATPSRFGVFGVGPHLVGVPVAQVEEMFVLPRVHRQPGLGSSVRGLVTLRGAALPAVDLRVCLDLPSAATELEALLSLCHEREQDHRAWLEELEASVRERRPFRLETDPRRCKFGRWYYGFKSDDAVLRGELAKIERPHADIHALAAQVDLLAKEERHHEALALLARSREGLLAELVGLFKRICQALREQHKEIGVTVTLGGKRVVLVVDRAEAVADLERIGDADDPLASGSLRAPLIERMARWRDAAAPVMVLDLPRVLAS